MRAETRLLIVGFRVLRQVNHGNPEFNRMRTITAYKTGASKAMRVLAKRFGLIRLMQVYGKEFCELYVRA